MTAGMKRIVDALSAAMQPFVGSRAADEAARAAAQAVAFGEDLHDAVTCVVANRRATSVYLWPRVSPDDARRMMARLRCVCDLLSRETAA